MKSLLAATALLAVVASPAFAQMAEDPAPGPVAEIAPATAAPTVIEPAAATTGEAQHKAAAAGHGCTSKSTVYLTN